MKGNSLFLKHKMNKKHLIIFTITMSFFIVAGVFMSLQRDGEAMSGTGVTVTTDGYITITEEAVAVATGTDGGTNCTWSVYETDEGYVMYFEPTDSSATANINAISSFASDYSAELAAIKFGDGFSKLATSFAANCKALRYVDASECTTLYEIGQYAFQNDTALEEFVIGDVNSIKTIGIAAFANCGVLKKFEFEKIDNLTTLGGFAFANCATIEKVDLSKATKIKTLAGLVFRGCKSLKEVILPEDNNITTVGEFAFLWCDFEEFPFDKLTKVTTIAESAFMACPNLKSVDLTSMTNLTSIGKSAFQSCTAATEVRFPENAALVTLGSSAFNQCTGVVDFDFQNLTNLESIGTSCFYNCTSLEIVDLSNSSKLTTIDNSAFYKTTNLKKVYLPENSAITSIGSKAFYQSGIADFPFENLVNLETLGSECFRECKSLREVDLSNSTKLTEIPSYAFYMCTSLKNTVFPEDNQIKTIGYSSFAGCTSLKEVNLEKLSVLEEIGDGAFKNTALKTIEFAPDNVIRVIGKSAFYGVKASSVTFERLHNIESFGDSCFEMVNPAANFQIADLSNCVKITSIPKYMFARSTTLKEVILPENSNITSIGERAFVRCTALLNLDASNLPELETIGVSAFHGCTKLTELDFSYCPKLATIEDAAFAECSNLQEISFKDCAKLSSVGEIFSLKLTKLKYVDFSGCSSLPSITDSMFAACPSLETVDITGCTSLETIGANSFAGCSLLTELTGMETCTALKEIGENTFSRCTGLTSIDITPSLETIGAGAFANCTGLTTINYNSNKLTSVSAGAFDNVGKTEGVTINISSDIDTVAANTFNSSINAKSVNFEGVNESLILGENAFAGVGSPLAEMSDGSTEYYVDEYGVVYSIDKTTLYYIPAGIQNYTVPATVTGVASNSCAMADDLVSIEFEDISLVTKLDNNAFANCTTLSRVVSGDNVATTVNDAAALFANAEIGANVFYNTGLLDSVTGTLTADTVETKTMVGDTTEYSLKTYFSGREAGMLINEINTDTDRIPNIENPNEKIYYFMTNEMAKLNIILSANSASVNKICRVYFQCSSDDMNFDFVLGEDNTISTDDGKSFQCAFRRIEGTNTYYLEFVCEPGGTIGFTTSLYYSNLEGNNETVKVWSQIADDSDVEIMLQPDEYQQAQWYTAIQKWSVAKSTSTKLGYITVTEKDGVVTKRIDRDMSYTIVGMATYGNDTENDSYGADPAVSITYEDTLILPEGIYWAEEVVSAIQKGWWYYSKEGEIYIGTDDGYILLADTNKTLSDADLIYNEETEKVTICFTIANSKLLESSATGNKWEMNNQSINFVLNAKQTLVVGDDYDLSVTSTIGNKVTQKIDYLYADINDTEEHTEEIFAQNAECSLTVPVSNVPKLTVTKKFKGKGTNANTNGKNLYGGERVEFEILVQNLSAVDASEALVRDNLPAEFSIKPDDMEVMFNEEYGSQLVINIKNAYLQPVTDDLVTDIYGNEITIDPVDTGEALESSDRVDNIKIKWSDDGKYLTVDTGTSVYEVGEDKEYSTLKECMNNIGFICLWETRYECRWYVPSEQYVVVPAETRTYMIYTTVKNSFEKMLVNKAGNIFEGTKNFETGTRNVASTYYNYDSTDSYSKASASASANALLDWFYDYVISKSIEINGEIQDIDEEIKVTPGDVLEFSVSLTHRGNAIQESIPLVDKMSGIQAAMALASENEYAVIETEDGQIKLSEAGLDTYTDSRNRVYYILSKEGTYRNVKIGTNKYLDIFTADRIIVTKSDETLDTEIHWYFGEISGAYSDTVKYQAIVSDDFGEGITNENVPCSNMAYWNERENAQIYTNLTYSGEVITSDKSIVTSKAGTDEEEVAKYSAIAHGESVTYKLSITNCGSKNSKKVAIAFDILPSTYGVFEWSKKNVSIEYVSNLGSKNATVENWKISDNSYSGAVEEGQYYIYWNNSDDPTVTDCDIVLKPNETIDFYVTLQFPDDDDGQMIWSGYEDSVLGAGNAIYNIFTVNGDISTVQHSLKTAGEAVLQKGVYGVYKKADTKESNPSKNIGIELSDRNTYVNSDNTENFVTYYVALYNSSDGRLYINDLIDILPEGFTFKNLCAVSDIGTAANTYDKASWRTTSTKNTTDSIDTYPYIEGESDESDEDNLLVRITDIGYGKVVEYVSATVNATVSNGKVTFKVSKGEGTVLEDEDTGMCYLEKGQAIVFGYIADIGKDYETNDVSNNMIAMQYYDYNGAGFKKSENVVIDGHYLIYPESVNEGTQEVMSNVDAQSLKFEGAYNTDWLYSQVALNRGEVIPGITKNLTKRIQQNGNEAEIIEGGLSAATDTQIWTVEYSNTGDANIESYTITETMQAPYYFTGDITLQITDPILNMTYSKGGKSSSNSVYTGSYGNVDNDVLIKDITFVDSEGNEISKALSEYEKSDVKIQFKTEIGTTAAAWSDNTYETTLGEEIECEFTWFYWKKESLCKMTVLFDIDDDGCCVMKITFNSNNTYALTGVPAYGGNAVMTVQTRKPTNITIYSNFINKAMITPLEEWDYNDVSVGTVARDSEENVIGVEATAMFTVSGAYTTTSWKTVTDNSDESNSADSRNTDNYITLLYDESLEGNYSDFTYNLNVQNKCQGDAISKIIVIDNLPEIDDHMAYASEASKRYSEYKVMLKEISDNVISVSNSDGTTFTDIPKDNESGLGYTVEFSKETVCNDNDWNGEDSEKWLSIDEAIAEIENNNLTIEELRSFRVIVSGGDGIKQNNILTISVNAKISGEASRGKLAWNNFGYKYYIENENGTFDLSASSLTVGVMTATVPRIRKVLNSGTGEALSAESLGLNASFIVYRGARLELSDEQEILQYLDENDIEFAMFSLDGNMIDSQSYFELSDISKCSAEKDENGNYHVAELTEKWKWIEGENYTFIEVEIPDNVIFSSLQNSYTNSYTITYDRASRYNITCKNIYNDYNLYIDKAAQDTKESLGNAVFARYGVITGDPDDEEYQNNVKALWSRYLDKYIEALQVVKDNEKNVLTMNATVPARIEGITEYDDFIKITGTVADINNYSDIGDYFCQFYTMYNLDGTETTYYFMDYSTTDDAGQISYKGIVDDTFGFVEIVAPKGYSLEHRLYLSVRSAGVGGSQHLTVLDKPAAEYPITGGNGEMKFVIMGMAMMLLSMMAVILRINIKRKGGLQS